MDDRNILKLLLKRSERALEELAKRFGKRLKSIALHILGSKRDAEECENDTYLAVWNTVPPKQPDPLAGYVYALGRNIALDRYKFLSADKRDSRYDVSLDELEGCIPAPALEEQVEAQELGAAINRFLATLSRDNRAIFLRRYWFGDGVGEIARDFSTTAGAVSLRLGRMRTRLHTHLVKEGYVDE
jgi:RNA polymerase sigma-70 factor (ECF subfamily)